jgi:hypothetical protein
VLVLHGGNVRSTIENSCFLLRRSLIDFIVLLSFVLCCGKSHLGQLANGSNGGRLQ